MTCHFILYRFLYLLYILPVLKNYMKSKHTTLFIVYKLKSNSKLFINSQ